MTFPELSPILRGLILSWIGILYIVCIFNMIRCIRIKSDVSVIVAAVLCSTEFCIFQICMAQNEHDALYIRIPLYVSHLVTAIIVLTIAALVSVFNTGMRSINNITTASIKESFDSLPTGLCFYYESGMPKLVNSRMEYICRSLTGHSLRNAVAFVLELTSGSVKGCIEAGDNPIYRLDDETVLGFSVNEVKIGKIMLYELIASDVTDEYRLTETLREKEKQAGYINKRLKALLTMTGYNVMERELLELKVNLHDNLGRSLLLAKRCLMNPLSVDKRELVSLWDQNIRILKNEQPEYWQKPYYLSRSQAMLLGVDLIIDGELPTDESIQTVINTAITVHVTNVLRHAEGTKAYINVAYENGGIRLIFSNDGKEPETTIKEKGGLSNLRKIVENAGGTMKVMGSPAFEMVICLPDNV